MINENKLQKPNQVIHAICQKHLVHAKPIFQNFTSIQQASSVKVLYTVRSLFKKIYNYTFKKLESFLFIKAVN